MGYVAHDMDEKWYVCGGRVSFVHRSWTGHGIYEASFVETGGGWHIASAVVESDAGRYRRTSDEYDSVMLELVISAIVLGERCEQLRATLVAMSTARSGRTDVPAGLIMHSALGLRPEPRAAGARVAWRAVRCADGEKWPTSSAGPSETPEASQADDPLTRGEARDQGECCND
jgi:hypothetical protein